MLWRETLLLLKALSPAAPAQVLLAHGKPTQGRPMVKSKVLGDERPMGKNAPTAKSLVVADERDLGVEQKRLCALIDRFASSGPEGCTMHPHTFFGRLTPDEWAILMYKHLDHHLRQFGV